jgi:hypothetical protein
MTGDDNKKPFYRLVKRYDPNDRVGEASRKVNNPTPKEKKENVERKTNRSDRQPGEHRLIGVRCL